MNIYWCAPYLKKFGWGIIFVLGLIGIIPFPGMAQITPDDTLGNERSRVNRNVQVRGGNADRIEGGATRGSNLFHSFEEFNVNEGQRVYFANPSGIANILSRVTGRDVSDIMGTLGVEGGANLFLLNPNGIIFGPNARLDISGSFFSSTADSFTFPDGTQFSATNPGDSSLLSVNVPLGVQYGPGLRGDITNAGNLVVNPGQGITLYGDTVISSGSLTAPGGTVQVLGNRVALTDNARIDVSGETGGGTVLIGGDYRGQGAVPNALRTFVGSGVVINADARTSGNGGRVIVWADEATGFYGTLTARGGVNAGNGGFAEVSGRASLDFLGRTDLSARQGQFGTLLLDPANITVVAGVPNSSELPSGQFGSELWFEDNPGGDSVVSNGTIDAQQSNVVLEATNNITFNAPVSLRLDVGLTAEAGNNLVINSVNDGAGNPSANTILTNNGDIVLRAGSQMQITGGISSRGADISLTADTITVEPSPGRSAVVQTTDTEFGRTSGALNINARELRVLNGGQVSVDTTGSGDAGDLTIQNADLVEVSGIAVDSTGGVVRNSDGDPVSSILSAQVQQGATGGNGSLTINTGTLRISNGGLVTTSTFSSADAGDLTINAELVEVSGMAIDPTGRVVRNSEDDPVSSILRAQVQQGATGGGGDLIINTRILRINNGGLVTTSTFGSGGAGDLTIQNADLVEVSGIAVDSTGDPVSSILSSQVQQGATGGNGSLTINTGTLRISNGGLVTASTFSSADAGDLIIQNADLVEVSGIAIDSTGRVVRNSEDDPVSSILRSQAEPGATGGGGDLTINTRILRISNGGLVTASTFTSEDAGKIDIQAAELVEVSGVNSILRSQTEGGGGGGDVFIDARTLRISDGGLVTASTLSSGVGGNIEVDASQSVVLEGNSRLSSQTDDIGAAGEISITTPQLVLNRSNVTVTSTQSGEAGELSINALDVQTGDRGNVVLRNGSALEAAASGGGTAGNLEIQNVDRLRLREGSRITVRSTGTGEAGSLFINARDVLLDNGIITATTEAGSGGAISLENLDLLRLNNQSEITASTKTGQAGSVRIDAQDVVLRNNSQITASAESGTGGTIVLRRLTPDGQATNMDFLRVLDSEIAAQATGENGQAGNLRIRADNVLLSGTGNDLPRIPVDPSEQRRGGLFVRATGTGGRAGNLTVNARQVIVEDGARISASNVSSQISDNERARFGNVRLRGLDTLLVDNGGEITASTETGQAGSVTIDANDSVEVSGEDSRIAVEATGGSNPDGLTDTERREIIAGDLTITTNDLTIQDGAEATVSSQGVAGDLDITANSIELDDGDITAIAGQGDLGNITINLSGTLLQLYNDSQISAGGEERGSGGNLTINAENGFVLADPYGDSDILANAEQGRGGDIEITTNAIFGLEERNPRTRLSDINAASEFSTSGNIVLNTLQIDPTRGLGELPIDIVDASSLVAEGCIGSNRSGVGDQGEFTRTGRGGLSPDPTALLMDESLIEQIATHQNEEPDAASSDAPETASESLVEAQGLARNANGKVSLVSNSTTFTVTSPVFTPNTCDAP